MTLHHKLKKMSLKVIHVYSTNTQAELFIIAVYVDAILLATKCSETRDLGELHYILDIAVNQNPKDKSIWTCQPTYVASVFKKLV